MATHPFIILHTISAIGIETRKKAKDLLGGLTILTGIIIICRNNRRDNHEWTTDFFIIFGGRYVSIRKSRSKFRFVLQCL